MSDKVQGKVSLKEWEDGWHSGDIGFHMLTVNSILQKQFPLILGDRDPASVRVFVPLCGKALELVWLYKDMGCTVVGVEAVEKAMHDFQTENNIQLEEKQMQFEDWNPKVFQTADSRLKVYVGDLFKFLKAKEEKFDFIFDRGSFVAIDLDDRSKYSEILTKALNPGSHWLIEGFEYDDTKFPGPPHKLAEDFIEANLGSEFDIKTIHEEDFEKKHFMKLDFMLVKYFLLKKK